MKQPARRSRPAGPLAMGGLGLLALLVAAVLLREEHRALAWAALALAAAEGALAARELMRWRSRDDPMPDRHVGTAPMALLLGLLFLLVALLI